MDLDRWWPGFLADRTQIRDRLVAAYDDAQRGYHDLRHLAEVFARLDELSDELSDALLLAVWFHDAVYESGTSAGDGNEERSAVMAERELATVDAPPMLVDEVARLVRLTEHHRPGPDDLDGQLLCDADLAILAADDDRYAEYVAGVRAEYADVPEEAFRAGRLTILQNLLAKEHVFESARARDLWEARARANLTAEVGALSAAS
ncbi:MAG: HD domain-containing protein [Marmoricola sp.]